MKEETIFFNRERWVQQINWVTPISVALAHVILGLLLFKTMQSTQDYQHYKNVQSMRAVFVELKKTESMALPKDSEQKFFEHTAEKATRKDEKKTVKKQLSIEQDQIQKQDTAADIQESEQQVLIPMASSDLIIQYQPEPIYPAMSKRMGEEGKVVVLLFVGRDGFVEQSKIMESSGIALLDQAALEAVRQWQFSPPQRNGKVAGVWVWAPIFFKLDG